MSPHQPTKKTPKPFGKGVLFVTPDVYRQDRRVKTASV
jgi:hypothetical protein